MSHAVSPRQLPSIAASIFGETDKIGLVCEGSSYSIINILQVLGAWYLLYARNFMRISLISLLYMRT